MLVVIEDYNMATLNPTTTSDKKYKIEAAFLVYYEISSFFIIF